MSGYLKSGVWHSGEFSRSDSSGRFVRSDSYFRNWVSADGATGFKAEPDRYHLYVSLACPWAHRVLLARKLLRLEKIISISVVDPVSREHGWIISEYPGTTRGIEDGVKALSEIYVKSNAAFTGPVTVPVLWDRVTQTIVNNESSEILRMLIVEFHCFSQVDLDLYPESIRAQIDDVNEFVYREINNKVYECGFAQSQDAYDEAVIRLFRALDEIEARLGNNRYLLGAALTESDIRLFPTLIRFDLVYFLHFKCSLKRIADYPAISAYLDEMGKIPGVRETVNIDHIRRHYYLSHTHLNPFGIIPAASGLPIPYLRD